MPTLSTWRRGGLPLLAPPYPIYEKSDGPRLIRSRASVFASPSRADRHSGKIRHWCEEKRKKDRHDDIARRPMNRYFHREILNSATTGPRDLRSTETRLTCGALIGGTAYFLNSYVQRGNKAALTKLLRIRLLNDRVSGGFRVTVLSLQPAPVFICLRHHA